MQIRARMSTSIDGYVTTPSGWPALNNERWWWPDLDVFVLGSQRPEATPDHPLPGGSVEIVYSCEGSRSELPERPASQR
jgi:hypothetical protein